MITGVRLARLSEPSYVHWRRKEKELDKGKVKDPFSREYNEALFRWELAMMRLITARAEVSSVPERLLVCTDTDRRWPIYREIDLVVGTADNPELFIELKLKSSFRNKGCAQLRRSLEIARIRWPKLRGFYVKVYMGEILKVGWPVPHSIHFLTIDQLFERIKGPGQETVWVNGLELAAQAIKGGDLSQDEVDNLPRLRKRMENPISEAPTSSFGQSIDLSTLKSDGGNFYLTGRWEKTDGGGTAFVEDLKPDR